MNQKKKFREIVINRCYGGFGLSHEATMRYAELKGLKVYPLVIDHARRGEKNEDGRSVLLDPRTFIPFTAGKVEPLCVHYFLRKPTRRMSERTADRLPTLHVGDIKRNDPTLLKVVKELGEAANGRHAELKIVKIPVGVKWHIANYDGMEHVAEDHRTWG